MLLHPKLWKSEESVIVFGEQSQQFSNFNRSTTSRRLAKRCQTLAIGYRLLVIY
jgi:hypothetical protein